MKLPHRQRAEIPKRKLTDYLLSVTHREGRHKARIFRRLGYSSANWESLASALREHIERYDVAKVEPSRFGTRYVVEGPIESLSEGNATIRKVWFIHRDGIVPQLVTAYPLESRRERS